MLARAETRDPHNVDPQADGQQTDQFPILQVKWSQC